MRKRFADSKLFVPCYGYATAMLHLLPNPDVPIITNVTLKSLNTHVKSHRIFYTIFMIS